MPAVTQTIQRTEEVTVLVAHDKLGQEVRIGDEVTITLRVTEIRPLADPETGRFLRDVIGCAFVTPGGYWLHYGVHDADKVIKTEAPNLTR